MTNFIIIKTTFSSQEKVSEQANNLVNKKLCACAQIKKIQSIYSWNDKINHDDEFELSVKTKKSLFDEVEAEILKNHEYDTPQLIYFEFKSSQRYQQWLLQALK